MTEAAWLVDIGYVVKASEGKFKLDYLRARQVLREKCGRVRAFLFNGFDQEYGIPSGLQGFYHAMELQGFTVRLHPMQSGAVGANRQRRVDVDLASHLVWQAGQGEIETLVMTSGDQDFVPAVEMVREKFGKRVILFAYDGNVHARLAEAVDEWWLLEDFRKRLARP